MWYYSSYEYKVATNGLELLSDDCEGFGTDKYGSYLYKAPRPIQGGGFEIGLYVDDTCMTPYGEEGVNALNYYNDGGYSSGNNKNNNNNNYYYGNYYDWNSNQYDYGNSDEAVLELFNEVYEEFKYCTLCIDYPSYQDGYFNGEGYDDDDLINQCWKFYSHDTYECDTACIALGSAQGTINAFTFGGKVYGTAWDGSSQGAKSSRSSSFSRSSFQNNGESIASRLAANFFLLMCALCFGFACYAFVNADDVDFSGFFGSNNGKQSKLKSLLSRKEKEQVRIGARNDSDKKGPSMFSRMRSAPSAFVKKKTSKRASVGDKQRGTVIDVKPRQKSKVSKKSVASDASYAESYTELKVYSRAISSDNGRYVAPPPSNRTGKARIEIAKEDPMRARVDIMPPERLRPERVVVEVGDHDYEPPMRKVRSEGANKAAISILNRHKQNHHGGGFADDADDRVKVGVRTSKRKTNLNVVWEDNA